MKLRYLLILGPLVFLNGFVLTVLFLMVSREMTSPAPTPTEMATMEPTIQPTFSSTATSAPAEVIPPTNTLVALPTNTPVIVLSTPTSTSSPAPSASTPGTPTPIIVPGSPTDTPPPPSTTTTSVPPATLTPQSDWDFVFVEGSVIEQPNCGTVYLHGKITGAGGEAVDGKTVRLRWWENGSYDISGPPGGHAPGEWGFSPLSQEQFHFYQLFIIDIVQSEANPVPISNEAHIEMDDCEIAGQFTDITFAYAR